MFAWWLAIFHFMMARYWLRLIKEIGFSRHEFRVFSPRLGRDLIAPVTATSGIAAEATAQ